MMSRTHEVGFHLAEPGQRLRPVPHSLHLVTLTREVEARELDDVIFIIDNENLGGHRLTHGNQYISIRSTSCGRMMIEM